MTCPRCGAANAVGARYCTQCGLPLTSGERTCPVCGRANSPTSAFCGGCGAALAGPPPPVGGPPPPPPGGPPPPPPVRPPDPPPAPEPAPARRGGCGCGGCLLTILAILVVLGLGAGGLYLLIQNGTLTQHQLRNLVGLGTGEIQLSNLSDSSVTVTLTQADSSGSATVGRDRKLGSMSMQGFSDVEPGRYMLTLSGAASNTPCAIKVDRGDVYRLAILRTGVVITRDKEPALTTADALFPTSRLCKR